MSGRRLTVAVVGATGAVGGEFLRLFEKRGFPVGELRLLASARSVGKSLEFRGQRVPVAELTAGAFEGVDLAFFSAGAARAREFVPCALEAGAAVFDNSSAFRMDEGVPLVVPEINGELVTHSQRLYPVGNCTAIVLCMAVAPLRRLGQVERLVVSTYQSASGGGAMMMQRLLDETRASLEGTPPTGDFPYGFNLFSHNTPINEHGYNEEEWKVIQETRKVLGMPELRVNVTCIRVPVLRAHSESITVEFSDPAPALEAVHSAYGSFPGVRVVDDRAGNHFPTPVEASGQDEVLVGRVRRDVSNPNAVCLFACGDQLLKGAALNAVQIAERYLAATA